MKPLRLWPGILIVAVQWLACFIIPLIFPDATMYGVIAGLLGGIVVLLWWAFFSRAPILERLAGIALFVVALAATPIVLHPSIATGMMGLMFAIYAVPFLSLALVLWAAAARRLSRPLRLATMAAAILLVCGAFALLRSDGVRGLGGAEFAWRWSETHEEQLPALPVAESPPPSPPPAAVPEPATPPAPEPAAEWPGFRGPDRDGAVHGTQIATDWSASPPTELWRRPVGPGWSSFAVLGELVHTQEQRGEEEVVACYNLATGEPVWVHRDPVRFWEANAGAGPRATPAISGGRVYALGATGILNALDARTGALVWSRDAAGDTGAKLPIWGFSGSPIIEGDLVIVATAGRLAAYDRATGEKRWLGPDGGDSYSSPHQAPIGGTPQVLLHSAAGLVSVDPADGAPLWEYPWDGYPIVQPALAAGGDLLLSNCGAAGGVGIRRLAIDRGPDGWTVEERWTSHRLKPYFNDFVVHDGHAYGFDGHILACINLGDGARQWKGGRYGHGQLILLADQSLLLVLSEDGELALVSATPDEFTELARVPALAGKTWNHPVLAGDTLLVRNAEEMAAYRLATR